MDQAAFEFAALGTVARVVSVDGAALDLAIQAVRQELDAIDLACSRFRPDSELNRLNAAGGEPVAISPLFTQALETALRASRLTDGIVDPTVGEALIRLGYDRDFEAARLQSGPVRLVLRPSPGWQLIQLDRAAGTAQLFPGIRIDLGATAKALAADRSASAAAAVTGCGVLVSLGGDIAVAGDPPAQGWGIRVTDDSHAGSDAAGQTIGITSGGLATSSTTVRRWIRGGASLHHIIDPRTGMPADPYWQTVSVAAGSCVDANTGATAAIVLGRDAPGWLEANGLPARLVATDGSVTTVCGWPAEDIEGLPPAA
jgi:thiamine biosynthesis lipoprotein ApbE